MLGCVFDIRDSNRLEVNIIALLLYKPNIILVSSMMVCVSPSWHGLPLLVQLSQRVASAIVEVEAE